MTAKYEKKSFIVFHGLELILDEMSGVKVENFIEVNLNNCYDKNRQVERAQQIVVLDRESIDITDITSRREVIPLLGGLCMVATNKSERRIP